MNPADVPALLRQHGLHPMKGLGQNFLIDLSVLKRIVTAAEIKPTDVVLEIGAGLGSLTTLLAKQAQRVIAIELDNHLIPLLRTVLANYDNVEIIQGDILELDVVSLLTFPSSHLEPEKGQIPEPFEGRPLEIAEGLCPKSAEGQIRRISASASPAGQAAEAHYLIVANIPYYITSALIRRLLEGSIRPRRMVITVQKEVAERICAKPDQPYWLKNKGEMSLLALSVQVYGNPEIAFTIPAGAFYPRPKVDSAVVRIEIFDQPAIPANQLDLFFRLAKAGFSQKRKMFRNALSHGLGLQPQLIAQILEQAGIDSRRRAETLNLAEWSILTETFLASNKRAEGEG